MVRTDLFLVSPQHSFPPGALRNCRSLQGPTWTKVGLKLINYALSWKSHELEGTVFVNSAGDLSTIGIRNSLISRLSPPLVPLVEINATVDELLKLYPDILALGSPYNTGNETFGFPSGFKRSAAIGWLSVSNYISI